jgi:hypothetical protein
MSLVAVLKMLKQHSSESAVGATWLSLSHGMVQQMRLRLGTIRRVHQSKIVI